MSTTGDHLKGKLRIKQAIEHHLYGAFDERLQVRLSELIDQHMAMTQDFAESFAYKGIRYVKQGFRVHPSRIRRLHPDLFMLMDQWLVDFTAINDYERPLVMGYVQTVLNTSAKPSDYLMLFPTALVEPFKDQLALLCDDYSHVGLDEAEAFVTQHENTYSLLKIRLMTNLLGVD